MANAGGHRIVEFDALGGYVRSFDGEGQLFGPRQLRVCADGHLLIASTTSGRLIELDPSGAFVREIAGPSIQSAAGVTLGPAGLLFVTDLGADTGMTFDADGALEYTFDDAAPQGMLDIVGGPDFTTYAASSLSHRVMSFRGDVKIREVGTDAGLDAPGGLAFAPFRFPVRVRGQVTGFNKRLDFKQKAILSIAPGSHTIMLQFLDAKGSGDNLHEGVFGSPHAVLHGLEGVAMAEQKQRLIQANEVGNPTLGFGSGSITLRVDGKVVGDEQYFVPKKVRGTFTQSRYTFQLHARVTPIP